MIIILLPLLFILIGNVQCQQASYQGNEWEILGFNITSLVYDEFLNLRIQGIHPGWIGISYNGGMTNADISIIEIKDSLPFVDDYWGNQQNQIKLDKQQGGSTNVKLIQSIFNAQTNEWDVIIQRPVQAKDNKLDLPINITLDSITNFSLSLGKAFQFEDIQKGHIKANSVQISYAKQGYTFKDEDAILKIVQSNSTSPKQQTDTYQKNNQINQNTTNISRNQNPNQSFANKQNLTQLLNYQNIIDKHIQTLRKQKLEELIAEYYQQQKQNLEQNAQIQQMNQDLINKNNLKHTLHKALKNRKSHKIKQHLNNLAIFEICSNPQSCKDLINNIPETFIESILKK